MLPEGFDLAEIGDIDLNNFDPIKAIETIRKQRVNEKAAIKEANDAKAAAQAAATAKQQADEELAQLKAAATKETERKDVPESTQQSSHEQTTSEQPTTPPATPDTAAQWAEERRDLTLRLKIAELAPELNIVSAKVASKLLEPEGIVFNDKHEPTDDSVRAALTKLLEENPFLAKQQGEQQRTPGTQTSAMAGAERSRQTGQRAPLQHTVTRNFFDPSTARERGGGVVMPSGGWEPNS